MTSDTAFEWDRFSAAYQARAKLPTDSAHYGPDLPTESELRLLGDLRGKRVLELGCGGAQCAISFAKQGATAIGVDISEAQLSYARSLCEAEDVRVELRNGDMAELAFLRADTVDLVFSSWAFQFVEDLGRVFRQAHRVLKVGAPLVFSLPHPMYNLIGDRLVDDGAEPAALVRRSYFDRSPIGLCWAGSELTAYHHSFSDLYMWLARASYRVDLVLEPEPLRGAPRSWLWREAMALVPRTLIMRARKEGN